MLKLEVLSLGTPCPEQMSDNLSEEPPRDRETLQSPGNVADAYQLRVHRDEHGGTRAPGNIRFLRQGTF